MVDGVLGIQARTEGRLDRIADLQRALHVVAGDLEQLSEGPISGEGASLAFSRHAASAQGLTVPVRYGLVGQVMRRATGSDGASQDVLPSVSSLRWRFYSADRGWLNRWPPSPQQAGDWPAAIALEAEIAEATPRGFVRRVVPLPARP